jgi:hypothetical protein
MYLTKALIRDFAARETSQRAFREYAVKAWAPGRTRIFLSHSHIDVNDLSRDDLRALLTMLIALGGDVYIDWLDPEMPSEACADTAERLKDKIDGCDRFLLAATTNAVKSRWVPWELGYADKAKGVKNIAVIPIADPYGQWEGSEYLRLYQSAILSDARRLAVFPPSKQQGVLIEHWMLHGGT